MAEIRRFGLSVGRRRNRHLRGSSFGGADPNVQVSRWRGCMRLRPLAVTPGILRRSVAIGTSGASASGAREDHRISTVSRTCPSRAQPGYRAGAIFRILSSPARGLPRPSWFEVVK